MSLFDRHKHNWELVDKTILPPAFTNTGKHVQTKSVEDTRILMDSMREKVVHVFKCECGDIKVVKN